MSHFDTRDAQTRIKHGILREYAGAWTSIIGRGYYRRTAPTEAPPTLDLVYVDGFGGEGRYGRDADQAPNDTPIWGSPIIGIDAIETAATKFSPDRVRIRVTGVIVEEGRQGEHAKLVANLHEAPLRTPVAEIPSIEQVALGRINVLKGDFREVVQHLLPRVSGHVLALVDPYGSAMRLRALAPLVARERTDCIILFPWMDISRKGGSACKEEAEWTRGDQGNIRRINDVFGTPAWQKVLCNGAITHAEREELLADLYFQQLRSLDKRLAVKSIPLRMSGSSRVVYHLFLTTRNGDGALRMNDILRSAEYQEVYALWADEMQRQRTKQASAEQDSLFAVEDVVPAPVIARAAAETEKVEGAILRVVNSGETVGWSELKFRLANDVYTESEIKRALGAMRKAGAITRGSWDKNNDEIVFARR